MLANCANNTRLKECQRRSVNLHDPFGAAAGPSCLPRENSRAGRYVPLAVNTIDQLSELEVYFAHQVFVACVLLSLWLVIVLEDLLLIIYISGTLRIPTL